MQLDASRIGEEFDSFRYEVSREKIKEYSLAIGMPDPDPTAETVVAPPTFAACFTLGAVSPLWLDPSLSPHPNHVHAQQEFEFHRPMRSGDRYECQRRIADVSEHKGLEFLTFEFTCHDVATDEPVVTARTVIVYFDPERPRAAAGRAADVSAAATPAPAAATGQFADLAAGQRLPSRTETIDQARLIRYAGATADFTPLHWDAVHARRVSPTGGIIAPGMLSMGYTARLVTDWMPADARLESLSASFRAPCPLGATLTIGGEVLEVDRSARTALLAVSVELPDGGRIIDAARSRARVRFA